MVILNQKGSAMVLSLMVFTFMAIVIPAILYMTNTQLMSTTNNTDSIEAQYAAEAGIKRAIVGFSTNRTDWAWTNGNHNVFVDDTVTEKYYTTSIVPAIVDRPADNTTYSITSIGYVGKAHKRVVVTVTTASKVNNIYNNTIFSNGTLAFNGGQVKITGDIASNTKIDLAWTSAGSISGYANAPAGMVYAGNGINKVTAGDAKTISNQGTIDIARLTPPMPSNPTVFLKEGIDKLTSTWTSGQWGGHTYTLSKPFYYYDGNYDFNGHSFAIPEGQSVTIYVNGGFKFNSGSTITGGNLTIHAKDGFDVTGGYIQADTNGTVNLFTSGNLKLSSGTFIKGGSVNIYAGTGIELPGGYIQANNNGTVALYTTGTLTDNSNSYINGGTVTILAQNGVTLNGGSINQSLSGAVTKIYTNDLTLNNSSSVISGNGVGLVAATHNISLSGGTAATTLMIAGNNINASNFGVTVGGLYSNGTINISGVKVLHDNSIATSLNLGSGSGSSSDFSIISWSN